MYIKIYHKGKTDCLKPCLVSFHEHHVCLVEGMSSPLSLFCSVDSLKVTSSFSWVAKLLALFFFTCEYERKMKETNFLIENTDKYEQGYFWGGRGVGQVACYQS